MIRVQYADCPERYSDTGNVQTSGQSQCCRQAFAIGPQGDAVAPQNGAATKTDAARQVMARRALDFEKQRSCFVDQRSCFVDQRSFLREMIRARIWEIRLATILTPSTGCDLAANRNPS